MTTASMSLQRHAPRRRARAAPPRARGPAIETSSRFDACCVWPMPTTAQAFRHQSPSRTQTRFCCRHGPDVACATRAPRLAVDDALRGLADADEAGGHHRVRRQRAARRVDRRRRRPSPSASRRISSSCVNGAWSSATSTAPWPLRRPAFAAASSVEGDRVRSRTPSACGSMRWSMPRIHAGRSQTLRARSPAASTTAAAPSEIGATVVLAQRRDDVRLGEQRHRRRRRRATCALRIRRGVAPAARGDLRRYRARVYFAGVEQRARLQRGEADRSPARAARGSTGRAAAPAPRAGRRATTCRRRRPAPSRCRRAAAAPTPRTAPTRRPSRRATRAIGGHAPTASSAVTNANGCPAR